MKVVLSMIRKNGSTQAPKISVTKAVGCNNQGNCQRCSK